VDKLLIGVILILLGDFATNLVEKLKNRFWLGEESYSEIQNYIASTVEYLYAIENKPMNEEKIQRLSEKRETSRANIKQIRDKLLDE
jgi:hypothetical protein